MDDCVGNRQESKNVKMGASSNPDSAKFAALQDRKKQIEERLEKHHKELRKICLDEAELTGSLPAEYPFEQGEVAPTFRRRIGTTYQLNQNLLNNLNNEEEMSVLEMEMHMLAKMAQAALGLANENPSNKAARKAHMVNYEQHVQRHKALENKLHDLKISNLSHQQKHKKKPRPEHEDSVSMNVNMSTGTDPFGNGKPFRHSLRSLQYQSTQSTQNCVKRPQSQRYYVPDPADAQPYRQEPTFYKLSLDGYKQYEEQQETLSVAVSEGLFRSYPNQANISRTLPHASRRSPQSHTQYAQSQLINDKYQAYTHLRLSSPGTSTGTNTSKYYPVAVTMQGHGQRQYYMDARASNPLQLQPHQQYEQNVMSSGCGSGLGGYWKQSENGEFWCNASNESMKDKRFGSLDRRKNKRLQKKNVDPKSATLIPSMPSYQEATRTLPKSQAIAVRRHENRQLVRTQSLGSVGVNQVDSTCQSDDSSCGSENININCNESLLRKAINKQKDKEWYETSLDAYVPRAPSTVPSIAPEDKYDYANANPRTPTTPHHAHSHSQSQFQLPSPQSQPTTPKEIPAESKPSPRALETNLEIFNNNVPKNCTVVQQAQWKPYHEETKPFEMSDFYKYSTKYKKKPDDGQPSPSQVPVQVNRPQSVGFRNLPTTLQQQQQNSNRNSDVSNISSRSHDSSQLSPQVAETFSAEMNAWYQKHEPQSDNNNATLV